MYCIVLYCIVFVLYCIVLYWYCIVLYCIVLHYIVLYYIISFYFIFYEIIILCICITSYYTTLPYITLYYSIIISYCQIILFSAYFPLVSPAISKFFFTSQVLHTSKVLAVRLATILCCSIVPSSQCYGTPGPGGESGRPRKKTVRKDEFSRKISEQQKKHCGVVVGEVFFFGAFIDSWVLLVGIGLPLVFTKCRQVSNLHFQKSLET